VVGVGGGADTPSPKAGAADAGEPGDVAFSEAGWSGPPAPPGAPARTEAAGGVGEDLPGLDELGPEPPVRVHRIRIGASASLVIVAVGLVLMVMTAAVARSVAGGSVDTRLTTGESSLVPPGTGAGTTAVTEAGAAGEPGVAGTEPVGGLPTATDDGSGRPHAPGPGGVGVAPAGRGAPSAGGGGGGGVAGAPSATVAGGGPAPEVAQGGSGVRPPKPGPTTTTGAGGGPPADPIVDFGIDPASHGTPWADQDAPKLHWRVQSVAGATVKVTGPLGGVIGSGNANAGMPVPCPAELVDGRCSPAPGARYRYDLTVMVGDATIGHRSAVLAIT
jgi:hypothetical protein